MKAWPYEIIEYGKQWGFLDKNDVVILGIEQSLPETLPVVSENISRLLQLLCTIPERFYQGSLMMMAQDIGSDGQLLDYLQHVKGRLSDKVFVRADLFISEHGWQLLEMNVGSAIGGMHMTSLPRLAGYKLQYDPLEGWARHTMQLLEDPYGKMLFIVPDEEIEQLRKPLSVMLRELNLWGQKHVSLAAPRELSIKQEQLWWKNEPVKYLYFRDEQDALNFFTQLPDAMELLDTGCVCVPMGPEYCVISSKGALALLWEKHRLQELEDAESRLVESLVPETLWLTAATLAKMQQERAHWVLKPTEGSGGSGILCGCEYEDDAWLCALKEALAQGDKKFVLQRYVNSLPAKIFLTDMSGQSELQIGRVVWGPYIFNCEYIGTGIRAQSIDKSAVINYQQGAAGGLIGMQHA